MRARRLPSRASLGLALALAWAGGAAAQSADVPAGAARVEGRLLHAERPEAVADVEVLLYALSADGGAGLRSTRSDSDGRFRFEGISNDPDVVYLVGARAGDVPFGKRFRFETGSTEQDLVLEFSDPVSDTAEASAGAAVVRLERGCTHLRVEHSHVVVNAGERVIFVPEAERGEAEPLLEIEIPAEAEGFESLLGTSGLERDGNRVRFWGPLYTGEQEIAFGYGQALERKTLALGLPRGAPSLELLASGAELAVEAPGLEAVDAGDGLLRLRAEDLPPGTRVDLRAEAAPREASPLRATRAEVWLELDDAVLDVSERLEVVAPAALEGGGAPLLCLPLPPRARALRFSDATLAAGLRRDPSGDLALHGPLPEGATQVALSYRLPAGPAGARFETAFDRAVPQLSILVADTGVAAETDRLHRRRPVRAEDRIYLHWEAFAVEAGEKIALGLRPLRARGAGGGWTATGFALLAGLASLGFLLTPLRDGTPEEAGERSDPTEPERLALARALDDLEEDLETGKLDAEDHAALRSELVARGEALEAAAARAEAESEPPADAGDAGDRFCAQCGAGRRAGDRFCSHCGAALPGGAPPA